MKKIHYFIKIFLLSALFFALVSCKPDEIEIEVYSSDIQSVINGEVIEVPIKAVFKLLGDDKDDDLSGVVSIAKTYLPKESEISRSKGLLGDILNISSTIPFGTENAIKKYLKTNPRLMALVIANNTITLLDTKNRQTINTRLRRISYLFSLKFPAKKTFFRIVNDQKSILQISARAIFVNNKPFLSFSTEMKRRKSTVLEFSGDSGSVYKEIPAQFKIKLE